MTQIEKNAANPFTPMFGEVPPYLAGRELIIKDMLDAFEQEGLDPNLCTIFVGARGSGKTAMLTYLAQRAQQAGWIAAEVTAGAGMLDDILQRLTESAAHLVDSDDKRKLTGVSVGGLGSVTWENAASEPNWRTKMNALFAQLQETNTGVLITVDEVDPTIDEIVLLVVTFQHFVREGKRCALLMAGLPHKVSALLTGNTTSFLRRATRRDLGLIPSYEVEEAFALTVESGGKKIDEAALDKAVAAIDGFPFMFQLVGYRAWKASKDADSISVDNVRRGAKIARDELRCRVFDATWSELSENDIAFLKAMSEDDGKSSRADVVKRLGKSSSHVSTYKRRLLDAGLIEESQTGVFRFALPGFADYVREMTA